MTDTTVKEGIPMTDRPIVTEAVPQDGIERAREYLAKQPHCIGYPKCDGDLTATPHSDECPISTCSEPGLDELLASYAASEVSRVRWATLALLQAHEWSKYFESDVEATGPCPICRQVKSYGHKADCWYAAAIWKLGDEVW